MKKRNTTLLRRSGRSKTPSSRQGAGFRSVRRTGTAADGVYRWQKEFFENGAAAFQTTERPRRQVEEKQKRIEFLEKKMQTKDEVLAELMAEHIALKKSLGEL